MPSSLLYIPPTSDFNYWWNTRGEPVEPINICRGGESGVERVSLDIGVLYVKRQRNHLFRSLRHPFGLPTVMREKLAAHAFSKLGITIPKIVFSESKKLQGKWQAILVTRELPGYIDLANWYQQGGRERLGEAQHRNLLLELGLMHQHRWQHTCLYPKHIFLTAGSATELPELALLDLEKARQHFSAKRAARRDLDQLRRHSPMWGEHDWRVLLEGHLLPAAK